MAKTIQKINLKPINSDSVILLPKIDIDEINDVTIDSLELDNGQTLQYNSTTGKWENAEVKNVVYKQW